MKKFIDTYRPKPVALWLFLWMSLVWACAPAEEEEAVATGQPVEVTLQLVTRAGAGNPEDDIQSLRIYAFRNGIVEGYHYEEFTASITTKDIKMKLPSDRISFYVVANEKAAGPLTLQGAPFTFPAPPMVGDRPNYHGMTLKPLDLEAVTFATLPEAKLTSIGPDNNRIDVSDNVYEIPHLPMAAVLHSRISSNHQMFYINLKRSVAKMTLHFAKTGVGELYMGRGLYLYNDPQYGYLFPKSAAELQTEPLAAFISRKEDITPPNPLPNNEFYNDAPLRQFNGRVILHCGWPEETSSDQHPSQKLDINRIDANINDFTHPTYEQIPQKSFYLFANPYQSTPTPDHLTRPDSQENGYYLKIIAHEHLQTGSQSTTHRSEQFYVCLPPVEANDHLEVRSVFTLDGFVSLDANWAVKDWVSGGGDITFE